MKGRLFVAAVIALGVIGLGGIARGAVQDRGDPHGRDVFIDAGCGACHTLRDAGTSGQRAPDLDVVEPSSDHVARFVQSGGVGMPPFEALLTPEQIEEVAQYVAGVAGR
jgi:mono/diheme cytochrome c family protein